MNLDMPSVIKAGGIAAGISIILGALTSVPYLGCLLLPLSFLGYFLIPFGAGLGYGYFAPGKENTTEGLVGGFLTGFTSGLIYALLVGIGTIFSTGFLAAITTLIASLVAAVIISGGFGALGGAVWPQIQNQIEGPR